jgi:hypothetical protein
MEDKIGGVCNTHGKMGNADKILVRKHEDNRPLKRFRSRSEDDIKVNLKEIACEDVVWIHLFSRSERVNTLKCNI